MKCADYSEIVAADVDGLLGAESDEARRHLETCVACRRLRADEEAVSAAVRSRSLMAEAPFGLRTRIVAALEEEAGETARPWWAGVARAATLACAVLAGLAILLPRGGDPYEPLIESYYDVLGGGLRVAHETSALGDLEAFYAKHHGAGIPSHVVDLGRAGFRLRGGVLRDFGRRTARLTVYSDGTHVIVCDYQFTRAYVGPLPEPGGAVFFSRSGLNFCVTRMGEEVCVLVTRMPMNRLRPRLLGQA